MQLTTTGIPQEKKDTCHRQATTTGSIALLLGTAPAAFPLATAPRSQTTLPRHISSVLAVVSSCLAGKQTWIITFDPPGNSLRQQPSNGPSYNYKGNESKELHE